MSSLNYKHLHYFWVVAREGSMTKAAERLDVAVQTISGQLSILEKQLGRALFTPQGRGLALTDAGKLALGYADQIFQLGDNLLEAMKNGDQSHRQRLRVGITDGLPKLLAYELIKTALTPFPDAHLLCDEDEFEDLLADLALHRLDVVLTDRPAPDNSNLKLFSTRLGEFATGWFAPPETAERYQTNFPQSLKEAPLLLPSRHNVLRGKIDYWLEKQGISPNIAGEFEDNALLNTFGRGGHGIFPAPVSLAKQVETQLGAVLIGEMSGVSEEIYALSSEKRIRHPIVETLCQTTRPVA